MSKRSRVAEDPPTGCKRRKLPHGCFRLGELAPGTILGKRGADGGMLPAKRVRVDAPLHSLEISRSSQGTGLPFYPYNEYWEGIMLPHKVKEVPSFHSATEALSNLRTRIGIVRVQQLASATIRLPQAIISDYLLLSVERKLGVDSDTEDVSGVVIYSDETSEESDEESEELLISNDPPLTEEELLEITSGVVQCKRRRQT
jgi:hypothetical protein